MEKTLKEFLSSLLHVIPAQAGIQESQSTGHGLCRGNETINSCRNKSAIACSSIVHITYFLASCRH